MACVTTAMRAVGSVLIGLGTLVIAIIVAQRLHGDSRVPAWPRNQEATPNPMMGLGPRPLAPERQAP